MPNTLALAITLLTVLGCGAAAPSSPANVENAPRPAAPQVPAGPPALQGCAEAALAVTAAISPTGEAAAFVLSNGDVALATMSSDRVVCVPNPCSASGRDSELSGHPLLDAAPQNVHTPPESGAEGSTIVWHPGGNVFVTAGPARICLWDRQTARILQQLEQPGPKPELKFSPDGSKLALARGQDVVLWDYAQSQLREDPGRQEIRGHLRQLQRIAWHPNGRNFASAGSVTDWNRGTGTEPPKDEAVIVWNALNGRSLATLSGMTRPIGGLAWSKDGEFLAAYDRFGALREWRRSASGLTPAWETRVEAPVAALAVAPHGGVAAATRDGRLFEFATATGAIKKRQLDIGNVVSATYEREGDLLVAGDAGAAYCACGCSDVTAFKPRAGGVLSVVLLKDGSVGLATTQLRVERSAPLSIGQNCAKPAASPTESAPVVSAAGSCRRPDDSIVRQEMAQAEFKRVFPTGGWAAPREPNASLADRMAVACLVLHVTRDSNARIMAASPFMKPFEIPASLSESEATQWIETLTAGARRAGVGPAPSYLIKCPLLLLDSAAAVARAPQVSEAERAMAIARIAAMRETLERERACVAEKFGAGSRLQ